MPELSVVSVPLMPELRLAIAKAELACELELTRYPPPVADALRDLRDEVDRRATRAVLFGEADYHEVVTDERHDWDQETAAVKLELIHGLRVPPDELRPPCPECGGYPSATPDGWRCRDCDHEWRDGDGSR